MKKQSRLLALLLIVAVVMSLVGIFSVFAEDGATELAPTTVIDMDAKKSLSIANVACVNCGAATSKCECGNKVLSSLAITKVSDETEGVYWEIAHNEAAGTKVGSGAYITEGSIGTVSNVVVKSGAVTSKGTVIGDKNTDFMVIDLDVSADGAMLPKLQFHMRYGNSTGVSSQDGNGYPTIEGSSIDTLYISQSKKDTVASVPTVAREGEWVNITFVYDFRGEDSSAWKAYAYIDGYYVATFASATKSDAYYLQWLRLSFADTAVQANESVKVRNLTYKTYPVGWNGDMADSAALGQYGNTLYDIDELAYCFEGNNPSAVSETPIASIARVGVEDPILVYSLDELDAKFVEGDVVTLNKSIATPIFVNAANVTFTENEYTYNLVDTSSIADLSAIAYVVLDAKTREVVASGDADAFKEQELVAGDNIYIMLSDLTYTRVNGSDGTNAYGRNSVIDTNGYTLTFASSNRTFNTNSGSDGVIRINGGGKVIFSGTTDLTMINRNNAVIFENLEQIDVVTATLIDQRIGLAMFKNIGQINCDYITEEGTFTKTLVSIKGYGGRSTGVIFDNVNMQTTKSALPISNVSSGGYRYGSITAKVRINDSNIRVVDGPLLTSEIYANQSGVTIDADGVVTVPDSVASANQNKVELNITGSNIDVYSRVIDAQLMSLSCNAAKSTADDDTKNKKITLTGDQIVKANGMSADFDININGSNVRCASVVMQYNGTGLDSEDVDYSYTVDVNVDGTSAIDANLGLFFQRCNDPAAAVGTVTLADGVKLMNDLITRAGDPAINLVLAEGSGLVYTSAIEGCNIVVGPLANATQYTYTYDKLGEATVPFYWANGETPDLETVCPTPENDVYWYTWQSVGENAYKAEMTASADFAGEGYGAIVELGYTTNLKVWVNTTLAPEYVTAKLDGVNLANKEYTIETINGNECRVYVVGEVDIADACKKFEVSLTIDTSFSTATETYSFSVIDKINADYKLLTEDNIETVGIQYAAYYQYAKAYAALTGIDFGVNDTVDNLEAVAPVGKLEAVDYPSHSETIKSITLYVVDDGFVWIFESDAETVTFGEEELVVRNGKAGVKVSMADLANTVKLNGNDFSYAQYAYAAANVDAGAATYLAALLGFATTFAQ